MASLNDKISSDKVILVGDVGVGKTSLFTRFRHDKFEENQKNTVGEAEYQKTWQISDQDVSITLFDTAGMERHMSTIPHTYFRSARVLLLVYSIDDTESFDSLTSWVENADSAILSTGQDKMFVALVGNKLDLETDGERNISKDRAKEFAAVNDIKEDMIFEVSAKHDLNVKELWDSLALKIHPFVAQKKEAALQPQQPKKKLFDC